MAVYVLRKGKVMVVRECNEHGMWTAGCPICTDVLPQFEALKRVARVAEKGLRKGTGYYRFEHEHAQELWEALEALPDSCK